MQGGTHRNGVAPTIYERKKCFSFSCFPVHDHELTFLISISNTGIRSAVAEGCWKRSFFLFPPPTFLPPGVQFFSKCAAKCTVFWFAPLSTSAPSGTVPFWGWRIETKHKQTHGTCESKLCVPDGGRSCAPQALHELSTLNHPKRWGTTSNQQHIFSCVNTAWRWRYRCISVRILVKVNQM